MADLIDRILRLIGLKTLQSQFTFSYALIFILAASSGISLYFSLSINPQTINVAGKQRMLSQRMAKEALLVAAGAENEATLRKTMQLFEKSHTDIINGDKQLGMKAISDPEILQQMSHVEKLWKGYKQVINDHLKLNNEQTLEAIKKQSPIVLREMNKAVGMMTNVASTTMHNQLMLAFACVLMILVLVIFGRIFGLRMLMDNIRRLLSRMSEVGEGNFSHRFNIAHTDNEVGQMFSSYNNMLNHVGDLLKTVQGVAINTEKHIQNVIDATSDTNHGVNRQYEDIELVAAAMTEMSSTVQEVAKNAQEAEGAANITDQQAKSGGVVVGQSEDQVQQMMQNLDQTALILKELETETLSVGNVTAVINDIADQTNLLALNAAIEAARAGEQGRGFAVVADEVRTLAQRTQQSTQEIRDIINRLQSKAESAVNSMNTSTLLAEKSNELAQAAANSLDQIIESANTISSMNTMISTAAEQQSSVASEIDARIVSISDSAGRTKEDTSRVVQATEEIGREAHQLSQLVRRFQL
ncbi:methyl-accepting chemotaxis protein [Neptuniibacter sp.]|uniref:methyl-accepting chemotaxis protein n=1 Tax=Neptuniibacter sp. TaxID=1962643 RepID=UPI002631762B|nr:methyl-accepting chemotaxis protein [Neptuniibacter sp.]MCP4598030.1 methyl-accepting chemotaxis protein [Neptuniibacter sp.]